jgi:hypothetical protein
MTENGQRPSANGHNSAPDFGAQKKRMRASEHNIELAAFESRLRDAYVRPPAPAVAEAHVEAMLAEAEAIVATAVLEPPASPRQPHSSRWVVARRLTLVPLGVLAIGGGLAVAGVRPPEPLSDAFESVGIDVPGSDARTADDASDGGSSHEDGGAQREAPAESNASGGNVTNGGPTPGATHANPSASEGQKTAEQARNGQTPPDGPGRSEDQPAPQGNGTPPEDPGHPGHGKPDSPPGQSHSSAQQHGGGTVNKPEKPPKTDKPEKTDKEKAEN